MIAKRLAELGLELPEPPKALASYIPAQRHGDLLYISGQLPFKDGELMLSGRLTASSDITLAQQAMARAFLNGLAAATTQVELESIVSVVRLAAYVASAPDFTSHHLVANGASELAQSIFGEAGRHARAAVGVASLPLDAAVELEILFALEATT